MLQNGGVGFKYVERIVNKMHIYDNFFNTYDQNRNQTENWVKTIFLLERKPEPSQFFFGSGTISLYFVFILCRKHERGLM
jgi:hypothetical protein